jgi:hypothetical protein
MDVEDAIFSLAPVRIVAKGMNAHIFQAGLVRQPSLRPEGVGFAMLLPGLI